MKKSQAKPKKANKRPNVDAVNSLPAVIYLHGDSLSEFGIEHAERNFGSTQEQLAAYRAALDIRGFIRAKMNGFFTVILSSDIH